MRSSHLRRRSFVFASLGFVGSAFAPRSAEAQWGEDIPFLIGILTEAISTVTNLVQVLSTMQSQLSALQTMLARLDPKSFDGVLTMLRATQLAMDDVNSDVASVGYNLQSVRSEYQKVFRGRYATTHPAEYDAAHGRMQDEILASGQVAARAQSTVATMKANTKEAAAILSRSAAAEGEVAQLQALVQMLGLVASETNTLIEQLSTTGRVLTNSASATASQEQLGREKKKRNLDKYLDRGAPVPRMNKLP